MEQAQEFANAIVEAKQKVTLCPICRNLTAGGPCPICANPKRDESLLCVVADPRDVIARSGPESSMAATTSSMAFCPP